VLLGVLGGVAGIGVAYAGLKLLVSIGPVNLPRLAEISFDVQSLGFTLALSVLAGLLFGSIPAWRYTRSRLSLTTAASSRTASVGRQPQRARNVLVVAQVAMALVLLVSAALMIRTFAALRNVDPGFADARGVETMSIFIPEQIAMDPKMVATMQRAIAEKVAAIPGVDSVGFAAGLPMDGNDPNWDLISVEGKAYPGGDGPLQLYNYVSPGYFQTLGTRLVGGRDFTWDDLEQVRPRGIRRSRAAGLGKVFADEERRIESHARIRIRSSLVAAVEDSIARAHHRLLTQLVSHADAGREIVEVRRN
jgi:hypothetical protein